MVFDNMGAFIHLVVLPFCKCEGAPKLKNCKRYLKQKVRVLLVMLIK